MQAMSDTSSSFNKNAHSLQSWWEDAQLALVFLTRIPWTIKGELPANALNRAVRAFPAVGLLVGALGACVFGLAQGVGLPALACGLFAVLSCVLLTGALHEDGLADVADGFGGGRDKARKLEIMRDSRVGSYGVLAMVIAIGLRVSLLDGFEDWSLAAGALVGVSAFSRIAPVLMLYTMEPARTDGLAAKMERPDQTIVWQGVALAVGALWLCVPFSALLMTLIVSGAALYAFRKLAQSQIGGHTGDVCGASQQIIEIVALAALAAQL